MTHWHVANGTPGYLFDSDEPSTFDRRAEAIACAREEAAEEAYQRNDAASWRYVPADGEPAEGWPDEPLRRGEWRRLPLPRAERWTIIGSGRVGRAGPFAVAIDRWRDPYSLPYQWEGWSCDGGLDCADELQEEETDER